MQKVNSYNFYNKRAYKRPGVYTHLVGMGCRKPHCAECDCLFRLILGKNYGTIPAAVKACGDPPLVAIIHSEPPSEFTIERKLRYKVDEGAAAVDSGVSNKFYIPQGERDLIEIHANRAL